MSKTKTAKRYPLPIEKKVDSGDRYSRENIPGSEYEITGRVPDLISTGADNVNSADHRELRARFDRIIAAYVKRATKETFKDGINIINPDNVDDNWNDRPFAREIMDFYQEHKIANIWKGVMTKVKLHGWAFIVRLKVSNKLDNNIIFRVFSANKLTKARPGMKSPNSYEVNEITGLPTKLYLRKSLHSLEVIEITEDNFLFINPDADGDVQFPHPPIEPIWFDAVGIDEILYMMKNFDSQFGAGIPTAKVPASTSKSEVDTMASKLKKSRFGAFRALVMRYERNPDDIQFDFKGGASAQVNFPDHVFLLVKMVSSTTGYPFRYFVGDPGGALAAASKDDLQVIEGHTANFMDVEPFMIEFNTKFITATSEKYHMLPRVSERLTELEKAQAQKARAEAVLAEMEVSTYGELRERLGRDRFTGKNAKLNDVIPAIDQLKTQALAEMGIKIETMQQPTKTPPENNENQTDTVTPSSGKECIGPMIKHEMASHPEMSQEQAVAVAYKKCGMSRSDSIELPSINELKKKYNFGSSTAPRVLQAIQDAIDSLIGPQLEERTDSMHFNVDSIRENDQYYIIPGRVFDSRAKLKYSQENGKTYFARYHPDAIKKMIVDRMGSVTNLGVEHEVSDGNGIEVKKRKIGFVKWLGFDGIGDLSELYIEKDAIKKFPLVLERIQKKINMDLSAGYQLAKMKSEVDGIEWDFTHLDPHSVVLTYQGRCTQGGGSCSTKMN